MSKELSKALAAEWAAKLTTQQSAAQVPVDQAAADFERHKAQVYAAAAQLDKLWRETWSTLVAAAHEAGNVNVKRHGLDNLEYDRNSGNFPTFWKVDKTIVHHSDHTPCLVFAIYNRNSRINHCAVNFLVRLPLDGDVAPIAQSTVTLVMRILERALLSTDKSRGCFTDEEFTSLCCSTLGAHIQ